MTSSRTTSSGEPDSDGGAPSPADSADRVSATPADYLIGELLADQHDTHLSYKQLVAYVERTLPADERQAVEGHVAECRSCSTDIANLSQIAASVAAESRLSPTVSPRDVDVAPAAVQIPHERHRLSVLLSSWSVLGNARWRRPGYSWSFIGATAAVILAAALAIQQRQGPMWPRESSARVEVDDQSQAISAQRAPDRGTGSSETQQSATPPAAARAESGRADVASPDALRSQLREETARRVAAERGKRENPAASVDTRSAPPKPATVVVATPAPPPSNRAAPPTAKAGAGSSRVGAVTTATPDSVSGTTVIPAVTSSVPATSVTPPATSPTSEPALASEHAAIRATLRELAAAYTGLSVDEVRQVYPTVNAETLTRSFSNLSAQQVFFRSYDEITIDGATAVVRCTVVHSLTPKDQALSASRTSQAVFRLQKMGDRWVIVDWR